MDAQRIARLVVVWCLLLPPAAAWAQVVGGTIAGVVKDTSGAVMPGVTVEAASPALIEKVRSAVTDAQGLYRVVDLQPGVYTVTFTLPGFSTFRREGVELTTGFTAKVDAEMKVGSLEETVTVSGAAPVVDIVNVRQQTTIARSTLDALPTTRRIAQLNTLVPGATSTSLALHDVGGVGSERAEFGIHGQRTGDITHNLAGIDMKMQSGGGFSQNVHTFQEIVLETSGMSAEAQTGGIQANIVPKDGGNTFSGSFSNDYTGPHLQNNNITDVLRARGLSPAPSVRKFYDIGGGLGGPIKKDRLWFFTAHRWLLRSQYQQGNYFNKAQGTFFYDADLSRPAYTNDYDLDYTARFTWQAAAKHKITVSQSQHPSCQCFYGLLESGGGGSVLLAPEATSEHQYNPNYLSLLTWTYPTTNRLLLDATASLRKYNNQFKRQQGVGPGAIAVTDLSRNLTYNALAGPYNFQPREYWRQLFSVSYITGSHNFKTGFNLSEYHTGLKEYADLNQVNGARDYTFRNAQPTQVRIWAVPFQTLDSALDVAVYVQDQWTIRKLTLNLGLRYNNFGASIPAQHLPAGPFVPARDFAAVSDIPNWKNLNPRVGAAYDLFGTGRTALKVSLGRYTPQLTNTVGNPVSSQATSATRNWTDTNGNYVPDCILGPSFPGANSECGALSDTTFGQVKTGNTRFGDDALAGFNGQFQNWQASVSVQHQLRPAMALNVGYFRTWYGGFLATDNQLVTPANYNPYCIAAPVDSRLPDSGQRLCGLYDLTPTLFGQVSNLVTQASHYGKQTEVYNGLDVTLNARFGKGGQLSGGLSVGRTVTDNCFVVTSPQQTRPGFCHVSPPWSAGTQVKFGAVYPLLWDLQASAIYQNIPGLAVTASYSATNAEIRPSLGRDLGSCRGAATCNGTVTIELIPPNTLFEDRLQQVDFRFTRTFRLRGTAKVQGNFDAYNMLNGSTILSENTRYSLPNGGQWANVIQIMGGRLFKFSARLDF